jgi:pimeloyl-ACP methyl ester carboxylesterase
MLQTHIEHTWLVAALTGSPLVILQDCGHWVQREKPEEFHQVVSTFLDK